MRHSGWIRQLVAAFTLVGGLLAPCAAHAANNITVSGTVSCSNGAAVEGVWVASSTGGSGFARWWPYPGAANSAAYSSVLGTSSTTNVQLRVGCGGSYRVWRSVNRSAYWQVRGANSGLNVFCNGAGACSWGAAGTRTSSNLGAPLNCTWGALDWWHQYYGYYPLWSGNAYQWSATAAQNGWTVTPVAMVKSIVVWPPSNYATSVGHVAWVQQVGVYSGRLEVLVWEMNYDGSSTVGTGHTRARWYYAQPSWSYIVPPPASY